MSKRAIFVGVFLIFCVGAAVAYLAGARSVGNWIATPALVTSGWAALGHLVTLDDDTPQGWSNPQGFKAVWYRSLAEFTVKLLVFAGLVCLVLSRQ